MATSPWLILLSVVLVLLTADFLRIAFRKGLRNLPGPLLARFTTFYKLSLVAGKKAPEEYRKLHERYGRIVRIGPNHVSISDPTMIPVIYGIGSNFLKTPFYSTMAPSYHGEIMDSMFTTRDPTYHKAFKSPVAQMFSMTNMRNYETYVDECTSIFMNAMIDLQGQPLDLAIWLQWYTFDVIASITFQRRFGFLEQRCDVHDMIKGLEQGMDYVRIIGQIPEMHPWLLRLAQLLGDVVQLVPEVLDRFIKMTEEEVDRYDLEEKSNGRTDFLAQLREKEAKTGKIPYKDMINHLSNNLLAGSDTTAIALRSCFYHLIKTPHAYQKIMAEIDQADRSGSLSSAITYEESLALPYLQAVIKESLRMHPSIALPLERMIPKSPTPTVICGIELPPGTNVSTSAPLLHSDKSIFGIDADQFRPERWLEASEAQLKLMERSFFTFGYGARTCIGKNISLMEMGKFIPQILRAFEINWTGEKDEWETSASWFWQQKGIWVKFAQRGQREKSS